MQRPGQVEAALLGCCLCGDGAETACSLASLPGWSDLSWHRLFQGVTLQLPYMHAVLSNLQALPHHDRHGIQPARRGRLLHVPPGGVLACMQDALQDTDSMDWPAMQPALSAARDTALFLTESSGCTTALTGSVCWPAVQHKVGSLTECVVCCSAVLSPVLWDPQPLLRLQASLWRGLHRALGTQRKPRQAALHTRQQHRGKQRSSSSSGCCAVVEQAGATGQAAWLDLSPDTPSP